MRNSVRSLAVGIALVVVGASACSSTSTAASAPPVVTTPPSTSSSAAQPSAAAQTSTSAQTSASAHPAAAGQPAAAGSINDGIGHPVKVCALLPAATAAKISGIAVTTGEEQDTPSYKIYACNYTNAAGTAGFTITVLALDAAAGFEGSASAAGSGSHPISGLGDKAESSVLGVQALFGNVSITVANLNSDAAAQALIRALQPKL